MAETTHETLVIHSRLAAVAEARRWASDHVRAAGFDNDVVFAVELALSEALTNVIEHAYAGDETQEIRLSLAIDDEKLRLTIRDFGRKFDLSSYQSPNLDVPAEGGYGVYLIHQLMDEVNYDTSPAQGTRLSLVKYRVGGTHA
ncbi:MAG: ATP-binding protein [Chloroflexi bacterium]|nr:MAG: ATP-binding protein [Chloroflexota bacterium]